MTSAHDTTPQRVSTKAARDSERPSLPQYTGHPWVGGALPEHAEPWLRSVKARIGDPGVYEDEATRDAVELYLANKRWVWPGTRLCLLCDVHADAEAFVRSLVASGCVAKVGPADTDYVLTPDGAQATFLIAGDCLDKGPSNLRLLRTLKHLMDLTPRVVLLAGNHDVRALVGMRCAGAKDPRLAHLFVRMGKKSVPLFRELFDAYLHDADITESLAEESRWYATLFPDAQWYRQFPRAVDGVIAPKKIEQELVRIREKTEDFEKHCAKLDLSLAKVGAAVNAFKTLFLEPEGELSWLFERMQLVHREGSVLFIHAGVDDTLAARLRSDGVEGVNAWFKRLLREDLFELYHGPVGNGFRTKYRDTDLPLSARGVRDLHACGIYAVAHGHRNIPHGQRIIFRQGMLNFECDASIDQNTRALLGLPGVGGAVTLFQPDGRVLGISTDFPSAKVFDVARRHWLTSPRRCLSEPLTAQGQTMHDGQHDTEHDDEDKDMGEPTHDGKINFDSLMTREEAVAYFDAIVKGLKQGSIHFRRNDQELTLEAGSHVDVEVKASRKGKKQKVEIELSWRTEKPADLEID